VADKVHIKAVSCIFCGDTAYCPGQSWASWRRMEAHGEFYYACPKEFPPATAAAADQRAANLRFGLAVAHLVRRQLLEAFKRKAGAI